MIVLFFFAFFLFWPQLPFHIFLVAFSFAITTYILPFCFVWVLLFLLVVLVFLVGVSASDLTSSFLFLSWLLSCCFLCPVLFLLSLCSVFFLPVVCLILFLFFSSSSVSCCDSPLSCSSVSFCPLFSFCISFDFFSVFFFSFFLFFLIFCVFFSPGPRVRLKRKINEKNNFSHFVCLSGIFVKMSFAQSNCFFTFLVDFLLFTEHVFVRYSWNMFWGSKGLFVAAYLLLYRCFGVWWRAFFLSNLSLVPAFLGFVLFCVRVFFFFGGGGAAASFEFCWGFFLVYLPHLGLLLLRCRWSYWFFNLISWLLVCASRFRCCHFVLNLVGGACG